MAVFDEVDGKRAGTGESIFTVAAEDSGLTSKKKAEVDLQALDDRLRRAVLDGDVNYVQSRLGDRKLSEAEAVLLIRTKQEAEEKVTEALAAQDAGVKAETAGEALQDWTAFFQTYTARQVAAANAARASGNAADSFVLDANGQKYYSNFGYDAQGNYRTSFGEVVSPEGIVRSENGGETDLSRGIYTREGNIYNDQTGEAITYNPRTGRYIQSRKVNGENIILREDMTEEEAQARKEEMRRTNRVLSPAEVQDLLARQQQQDIERPHPDGAASSREGNEAPATLAHQTSTASAAGSDSREPSAAAPESRPTAAATTATAGGVVGSVLGVTQREAESTFDDVLSQVNGMSMQRNKLAGQRDNERARRAREAQRALPKGADESAIAGTWAAASASLQPNPQPGKDYVDKMDGLHMADGTYMDYKGNVVDNDGNLWIAHDKTGKPAFTKREGVDYTELLMARAEGPAALKKWVDADPARAAALKDVNAALQKLDDARTARAMATTAENWVYSSRGNYVDKYGKLWIAGELTSHGESGGADYIEMLKLAEKGKLDQWKSTGNLKKEEIEAIKEAVRNNEANLAARGYNLRKDLMGYYSTTQSKFTPPAAEKPEAAAPVAKDQPATQKRTPKAATSPT